MVVIFSAIKLLINELRAIAMPAKGVHDGGTKQTTLRATLRHI